MVPLLLTTSLGFILQHFSALKIFLPYHHYKLNRHPTLSDVYQILGIAHAAAVLTLPAVPAQEVLTQTLPVFNAKPCTFPASWCHWHSSMSIWLVWTAQRPFHCHKMDFSLRLRLAIGLTQHLTAGNHIVSLLN